MNETTVACFMQGKVELMETVSGAKEVVRREDVVSIVQARLLLLGPLDLVVPGRQELLK